MNTAKYKKYVILSVMQAMSSLVLIVVFTWLKLSHKLPDLSSSVGNVLSVVRWIFLGISGLLALALALFKEKILEKLFKQAGEMVSFASVLFSLGSLPIVLGVVYLVLGGSVADARLLFFAGILVYYIVFIKAQRWQDLSE